MTTPALARPASAHTKSSIPRSLDLRTSDGRPEATRMSVNLPTSQLWAEPPHMSTSASTTQQSRKTYTSSQRHQMSLLAGYPSLTFSYSVFTHHFHGVYSAFQGFLDSRAAVEILHTFLFHTHIMTRVTSPLMALLSYSLKSSRSWSQV